MSTRRDHPALGAQVGTAEAIKRGGEQRKRCDHFYCEVGLADMVFGRYGRLTCRYEDNDRHEVAKGVASVPDPVRATCS